MKRCLLLLLAAGFSGCAQNIEPDLKQLNDTPSVQNLPTITGQDQAAQGSQVYNDTPFMGNLDSLDFGSGGLKSIPAQANLGAVIRDLSSSESGSDGGTSGASAKEIFAGVNFVNNVTNYNVTGDTTPSASTGQTVTPSQAPRVSSTGSQEVNAEQKPEGGVSVPVSVTGVGQSQATGSAATSGSPSAQGGSQQLDQRLARIEAAQEKLSQILEKLVAVVFPTATSQPDGSGN